MQLMTGRSLRTRVRQCADRLLPARVVDKLRHIARQQRNRRYFKQGLGKLDVEGFSLTIPENHILTKLRVEQPLRDQCVKIIARHVFQRYPEGVALDVGANIGDTAAMMASACRNPLVLIEASDYFFPLLENNARAFPNPVTLVRALIGDGTPAQGLLEHWGGTARFTEGGVAHNPIPTIRLPDVAPEFTRFVKIDTDGFDYAILLDSREFLQARAPVILYENETKTLAALRAAEQTLAMLEAVGYCHFILWDDAGHLVGIFDTADSVMDVIRCLRANSQLSGRRNIHGLDIAAFCGNDASVAATVLVEYREMMAAALYRDNT